MCAGRSRSPAGRGGPTVFQPLQDAALAPSRWWASVNRYFAGLDAALVAETTARRLVTANRAHHADRSVGAGKRALACLARLAPADGRKPWPPRCSTTPKTPSLAKVVIDRGGTQGVVLGSPVLDDAGVLGQVTRVIR